MARLAGVSTRRTWRNLRLLLALIPAASPLAAWAQEAPPPLTQLHETAPAAAALSQSRTYGLWEGRAPGAQGDSPADTPTITVFPPFGAGNGTAVVIAPGGAYIGLATSLEGVQPANWFASRGITAFVLKYRTGPTARLPIPLYDGPRAIRFVRAHAKEFRIDPARIGMMGFSAGGHLVATTAVNADAGVPTATDPVERVSSRPDFMILAYPWLEGTAPRADGQSSYCDFAKMTPKATCDSKAYAQYLPLKAVHEGLPPTFIYHTTDDQLVPVEGSVRFFAAMKAAKADVEMHLFAHGPHGTGLGGASPALSRWPELLQEWLGRQKLLPGT